MLQRNIEAGIVESLRHFPVTLLIGARQVGKTTLVRKICSETWPATFLDLDERVVLDAALTGPDALLRDLEGNVAVDEVQRAPDLLRAVKLVVDRDRRPGRFLLTGSANLTTLASVSETLAGRAAVLELLPLTLGESLGQGGGGSLIDSLFALGSAGRVARAVSDRGGATEADLQRFVLAGGYPDPCLAAGAQVRDRWFASYRRTYVERDVRDAAGGIQHVADFSRLLAVLALRTGAMLNHSALSRRVGLPVTTLRRYLSAMEQTFQVFTLPPFHANLSKRLVKTPKVFAADTGFACHLAGIDDWDALEQRSLVGQLVETWVAGELRKALAHTAKPTALSFMRTQAGAEVDFVLERADRVIGLEVKWGATVGRGDLAGLAQLRRGLGDRFLFGIVAYRGDQALTVDDRVAAVPLHRLFGPW